MHLTQTGFTWIGFIILAGMVLLLFGFTAYEAWLLHLVGGVAIILVMVGLITGIIFEGRRLFHSETDQIRWKSVLWNFLAVFTGGIFSFSLSHDIGLGPVVAASLVGIIGFLVIPDQDVPIYCGAFVGMTSNNLLYTHTEVAIASAVAGGIYILTRSVFSGFGGKLGTIALVGTILTGTGLAREFTLLPIPGWQTNALIILISVLATPLTFYLNIHRDHGPVLASAVVGLASGLILPELMPQTGSVLAVIAICASFTGMSGRDRCQSFWHILPAGLVTGIVFVYSTPLLGGAGGKLGTVAFGAVLSICGYMRLFKWLFEENHLKANK